MKINVPLVALITALMLAADVAAAMLVLSLVSRPSVTYVKPAVTNSGPPILHSRPHGIEPAIILPVRSLPCAWLRRWWWSSG